MKVKGKHHFFYLIAFSGLMLGISGCSTRRNTFEARLYHRLTGHYNVYWNGKQSLDKGVAEIRKDAVDNFSHVLRVYNYGDAALAKQISPLMQDAIKQASEGIQKHSMVFNGKELVRWVDYSYLMMGQANFYKKDYTAARRIFDFVARKYSYDPIHYYGMLWLAKTYIESGDYEKADAQLNLLRSRSTNEDFPVDVKKQLPLVAADLYLAENNLDDAYTYLEQGLKTCRKRQLRTRIMFILGQINQKENHLDAAAKYFKEVIKRSPEFHLDFEARLRLATSFDTLQKDHKYVEKTLKKMASSHQYHQFLDKIYYALAQVAERSHQDTLMVHYLKLSVSHGQKDNWQRTTAAVKLAKTYFKNGDYVPAQAYYDTAVMALPKDYPDHDRITKTAAVLSQVVKYAQTIQVQDSLQRLSKLNKASLYALIDKKIENYKKAQEKEAEKQTQEVQAQSSAFQTPNSTPQTGGVWYFYNSAARSRGYNEFIQQWGNRKLQDLWFLSQQQNMASGNVGKNQNEAASKTGRKASGNGKPTKAAGPMTRAFYLKNIPKTPRDYKISDSLIRNAYKGLGFLYLETLHDTTRALKTYLALQQLNLSGLEELQNWYTLYQIYSGLNQEKEATVYKDLIVKNYPNSLYTKVIKNPDYYKEMASAHAEASRLYDRTYKAFENQQYYRALNYVERARSKYSNDTVLMPKFLFIRAVSIGKVQVPDSLYKAMQLLVKSYPHSDLIPRAKAIILMLQKEYGIGITPAQRAALLAKEKQGQQQSIYTFNANAPQLIMVVVKSNDNRIKPLIVRLSDFNRKNFKKEPPEIKNIPFTGANKLITFGNFGNVSQAAAYYRALQKNTYVFSGMKKKDYQVYIISLKNYTLFYNSKNLKSYQEFYSEHFQAK